VNGLTSISTSVSTGIFSDASGDYQYGTLDYSYAVNGNAGQFSIEYSRPLVGGNVDINVGNTIVNGDLTLSGDIKSEGNINIDINLSDSTLRRWQFGEDGILTVPGPISGLGNAKLDFTTYGANVAYLTTTSNDATALYMSSVSAELYAHTNIFIRTNTDGASKQWTFGDDGSLTTPGNITLPNGSVIKDTDYLAVAFGSGAGTISQGFFAVAVGQGAGYNGQGNAAVAIGSDAGGISQGLNAVAVGAGAGYTGQGINAVAIGIQAGYTNQGANSIILNATGATLNQTTANTFTVKPVRNGGSSGLPAGFYQMAYNPTTGEIVYYT
jgi:hypothetical protein